MSSYNSIIAYYGGKLSKLGLILPMIPPHKLYCEPFSGSAAVLLNKARAEVTVYNDMDSAVVAFFRALRDTPKELKAYLELLPYSREEFEKAKEVIHDFSQPEFIRAAYFFLLSDGSINNNRQQFSYARSKDVVATWNNKIARINQISKLLKGVTIEHLDAINCIDRYDSEDTFFYVDPPYVFNTRNSEKKYAVEYTDIEHHALLIRLNKVLGMVLLSGYNSELYDNLLSHWHKQEFEVYSTADTSDTKSTRVECLWYNYEIPQLELF